MMNSQLKQWLILGGIGIAVLIGVCNMISNSQREEREVAEMEELAEQRAPISRALNILGHPGNGSKAPYPYLTKEFIQKIKAIKSHLREEKEKGDGIYTFLKENHNSKQPEHVCTQWQTQLNEAKNMNRRIESSQKGIETFYADQLKEWEAAAQAEANSAGNKKLFTSISNVEQAIKKIYKDAKAKANDDEIRSKRAKDGYDALCEHIAKDYKYLQKIARYYQKQAKTLKSHKDQVIGQDNRINHNTAFMQEVDALMGNIRETHPYDLAQLVAPTILPAPPPPPFEPDIHLVATGDLAETLLAPLVEAWLKDRGATPLKGNSFMWNLPNAVTRELEANAPAHLQGKETGKLRIRITTEPDSPNIFTHIQCGKGDADMVLTGRKMNGLEEKQWLPVGQRLSDFDPESKGRTYRMRLCSDALLFFRGRNVTDAYLRSSSLRSKPKVYSDEDAGNKEAAAIFGLQPGDGDKCVNTKSKSIHELMEENPDSIILGTWHKDNLSQSVSQAMNVSNTPTLSYAAGMDSDLALNNADKSYVAASGGCTPTESSINSGQYAFSYSITFFRPTTPREDIKKITADLMLWAGDINNKKLEALVRSHGYVPVKMGDIDADSKLTDADLPLEPLLPQLNKFGFGYPPNSTWVNGVRITIPLYYEVGSAETSGNTVDIDPDSQYYTEAQAIQLIRQLAESRQVCLVLVGHADPQYGKKIDMSKDSWQFNLGLSNKRASSVYSKLFAQSVPDTATFKHSALGCSWARPACDISVEKSIDSQYTQMARCRRVEVFLVFPLTDK